MREDKTLAGVPIEKKVSSVRNRKVSLRTKLAFSSGCLQEGTVGAASITTLIYYNQILGLSPELCGIAFMVVSIVDAISDPLVGAISDRFDSRWGRRHPLMFFSAFPLGLSFYFLYQPIGGLGGTGTFIWLVLCMVTMRLAYTFYNIPHDALGAELTDNYHERTSIFGYNTVIGHALYISMYAAIMVVLFPTTPEYSNGMLNEARYPLMAIAGSITIVGGILLCTLGTADQIPHLHQVQRERLEFKSYFKELLQLIVNPSYVAVCASWLTLAFSKSMMGMVMTYTYIYAFELSTEQMSIMAFAMLPGILVALPLATLLTRWLDKRATMIAAMLASTCIGMSPFILRLIGWFPGNDSPLLLWALFGPLFLGYAFSPVSGIVVDSMLVDIADDHEYRTGNRAEGIIFSIRTFAMKGTGAIGGIIGGFALKIIGFPQDAKVGQLADETIDGLLIIMGPVFIGITIVGVLAMAIYRLNQTRHQEILAALEQRRGLN